MKGWLVDNPSSQNDTTYETVMCTAFAKVHLVSPKTGKSVWTGRPVLSRSPSHHVGDPAERGQIENFQRTVLHRKYAFLAKGINDPTDMNRGESRSVG